MLKLVSQSQLKRENGGVRDASAALLHMSTLLLFSGVLQRHSCFTVLLTARPCIAAFPTSAC